MVSIPWVRQLKHEALVVGFFREKSACTPDLSVLPVDLHPDWIQYRSTLNRLISKGVVLRGAGNTFYMDENRLLQMRMGRIKWGLIVMLVISLVAMGWLAGGR
jgi:hypothetical protein